MQMHKHMYTELKQMMMHGQEEVVEAIKALSSSLLPTSQHPWHWYVGPPLLIIYHGTLESPSYILQVAICCYGASIKGIEHQDTMVE